MILTLDLLANGLSDDIVGSACDLEIVAAAGESPQKLPQFRTVAYHGGMLDLPGFDLPVVVDLQGMDIPAAENVPALWNHSGNDVVGHHTRITNDGKTLSIEGTISGVGAKAVEVRDGARNGIKWQSSIGAKRTADLQLVAAGQSKVVNGRTLQGPFYLAPKTRLGEVSFVAVGADRTPAAAVIASAQTQGSVPMKFSDWLKAKGINEATLEASARAVLEATFNAEITAAGQAAAITATGGTQGGGTATAIASTATATAPALPAGIQAAGSDGAGLMDGTAYVANMRRQAAEEHRRINRIAQIGREFNVTEVSINAAGQFDVTASNRVGFVDYAIEAGWTAEQAELVALRSHRPQTAPAQQQQRQALDNNVLLASLALAAGIPADVTVNGHRRQILATGLRDEDRQRVLNDAMSGRNQGMRLSHAMQAVCIQAGQPYAGPIESNDFFEHFRNCERMLRASGVTTVSLPGILSNIANKSLAAAYQVMAVVWPMFAKPMPLTNFKPHTIYRLTADGAFRDVGPDGQLEHGSLSEGTTTLRAGTKGRKFKFTRQMRIDDDLSALTSWGTWLGQEGPRSIERAVFKLLLANTGSFFSSGNGNLITDVLNSDGLKAGRLNFDRHVDSNGQPVLVPADRILCATALHDTADLLVNARALPIGGDKVTDRTHWGKFPGGVHQSGFLDNTSIKDEFGNALSGQSETLWFLFADPAVLAAMYVGFLNGQQNPTVETSSGDFSNDGLEIQAFSDFGVAFGETMAATKSTGAGA